MNDENQTPQEQWYDSLGLDDEAKGVIQTKGWQDAGSIIKSYKELEKFSGRDKSDFLELPKGDNADYSSVWNKLGRPENPDGYELNDDQEITKSARQAFYDAGLTKKQASQLQEWFEKYAVDFDQANRAKREEELDNLHKTALENLKKDWGADFDTNAELCKTAVKNLGITDEQLDAIGDIIGLEKVTKMFLDLAQRTDADKPLTGYESGGKETPEQAKARIAELQADAEFMKKVANNDKDAVAEMIRLANLTVEG